jgi:hypothetical protein
MACPKPDLTLPQVPDALDGNALAVFSAEVRRIRELTKEQDIERDSKMNVLSILARMQAEVRLSLEKGWNDAIKHNMISVEFFRIRSGFVKFSEAKPLFGEIRTAMELRNFRVRFFELPTNSDDWAVEISWDPALNNPILYFFWSSGFY